MCCHRFNKQIKTRLYANCSFGMNYFLGEWNFSREQMFIKLERNEKKFILGTSLKRNHFFLLQTASIHPEVVTQH